MSEQTYTLYVGGMHCTSCVLLIEDKLRTVPGLSRVKADLSKLEVRVTGEFDKIPAEVAAQLNPLLKEYGYTLTPVKPQPEVKWSEFAYALPIAGLLITAFIILQKFGLVSLITTSQVSYSTALLIGLIASTSSCLAVVGGLVLSLAASSAQAGGKATSQFLFHGGRLAGFFVLGGVLGALGTTFRISYTGSVILGAVIALLMLVLGLNLLDVFSFTRRLRLSLPNIFGRGVLKSSALTHTFAPLLTGVITFFLPCGFTQSMQLYALSTGSFAKGALTMLTFALGTLPVLALLSFSSFSLHDKAWRGIFFKTAGLVVVALALLNLTNILAVAGIIPPLFNF